MQYTLRRSQTLSKGCLSSKVYLCMHLLLGSSEKPFLAFQGILETDAILRWLEMKAENSALRRSQALSKACLSSKVYPYMHMTLGRPYRSFWSVS